METSFHIPEREEFQRGYQLYNEREKRACVYFEAMTIISEGWGQPAQMAQGVSRLVYSWNRFYASFDFDAVVACIDRNLPLLTQLQGRDISSLSEHDENLIKLLFVEFLNALKRRKDGAKSPVSVGKCLNPMAPSFLPLWDLHIASAYDCYYYSEAAADPYFRFCLKMQFLSNHVKEYVPMQDDRSLLKRIDEYNYSKYSMLWL